MNSVLIEVKIDPAAFDSMKAFLEEHSLSLCWQDEDKDFFRDDSHEDKFDSYCQFPGAVKRTYCMVYTRNAVLNEILHFHQKVKVPAMILCQYQNDEGRGYIETFELKEGKGNQVAYQDNYDDD